MSPKEPTDKEILEETNEIELGNAKIGRFNLVLYLVLSLICIIYFFTHLTP